MIESLTGDRYIEIRANGSNLDAHNIVEPSWRRVCENWKDMKQYGSFDVKCVMNASLDVTHFRYERFDSCTCQKQDFIFP